MYPPCLSSTRLLTSTFQVLPLAAARYHSFVKGYTPFGVLVLTDSFYLLSGLLNVILYAYTRPDLLPHDFQDIDADNQSMVHSDHDHAPAEGPVENAGAKPMSRESYADREKAHPDDRSGEGVFTALSPTPPTILPDDDI
jgi:hypothetical protein